MKYGGTKNIISTRVKNKEKYLQALEARGKVKKLRESDFQIMSLFVGLFLNGVKIFQFVQC